MTTSLSTRRTELQLSGDLNIYAAPQLKQSLLQALEGNGSLYLDLSAVEAIDGAGIQVLALIHREAGRVRKVLRMSGGSPSLLRFIATVGMQHYFGESLVIGDRATQGELAA